MSTTIDPRRASSATVRRDRDRQDARAALLEGRHGDPHQVLGAARRHGGRRGGVVIRVLPAGRRGLRSSCATAWRRRMRAEGDGFFAVFLPGAPLPFRYHVALHRAPTARTWERGDPYRHCADGRRDGPLPLPRGHAPPAVGRCSARTCARWTATRAPRSSCGRRTRERVSVVGDWCNWDGRQFPMRRLGDSGLWELFIPGVRGERALQVRAAHARGRAAREDRSRSRSRCSRRRARRPSSCARARYRGATTRG